MRIRAFLSATFIILFLSFLPARASADTVGDVSNQLICQCGCTLVLANCTHEECHSRENMTAIIGQQLAQGQSEEQIIASFVAQYGEPVLASPPKRGFNLMAWILPFAAILAGGGLIYFLIRKWVRRGGYSPVNVATEAEEMDTEYQHQLEEELKVFSDRSFR
jgi:cytochrome c-type biogenesis protein CcmH